MTGIIKKIWRFFSSTTLTVVIAFIVCLVAGWGSILVMRNREFYDGIEHELFFPWLFTTGTQNLNLTYWMFALVVLITLFGMNTTVCTTDRLYAIFKHKRPLKGVLPHLVHIGFIVALIGHGVGSLFGFQSYDNFVVKGQPVPVPNTPGLTMRLDDMDSEFDYRGRPKRLSTTMTILKDTVEIKTHDIEMNKPLLYDGLAFYQTNQGQITTGIKLRIDGGVEKEVAFDKSFSAADGRRFFMGRFYRDLAIDAKGKYYSRSDKFRNPHQEITTVSDTGTGQSAMLALKNPGSSVTLAGRTITLSGYAVSPYAVLTVKHDPSIWFIIVGSAILVTGMIGLLFLMPGRGELMKRPGQASNGGGDGHPHS